MEKIIQTPIGFLKICVSDGFIVGLHAVKSHECDDSAASAEDIRVAEECGRQIEEYFAGKREIFDLPLRPAGTPYMKRVWDTICGIPYGQTYSYKRVAELVADSRHCRSVAMSLHRNPILIIIPCHRIVGSDGSLTGFAAGLENKAFLINLEQRRGNVL